MKISYNWLKTFIKELPDAIKTGELLTEIGLEVEETHTTGIESERLKGLLVGRVVSCVQHPQADRLKCTQIDDGSGLLKSVVCGAPNVREGQWVVLAPVGCQLQSASGEVLKIKKSKIRGEISEGMLCAEDEIGIGTSHEGIIVLQSPELKAGMAFLDTLTTESDTVYEIGITPNRGDALSHYGVARDLAAAWSIRQNLPIPVRGFYPFNQLTPSQTLELNCNITAKESCFQFQYAILNGIHNTTSPKWLVNQLQSIGIKSINTLVDITNFLMHEWGQPLHVYDFNSIQGAELKVRMAQNNEAFIALDGNTYSLNTNHLVIADAQNVLALGGIIGGKLSAVTEKTTAVVLECAVFHPQVIRKASKQLSLYTEASYRFERGVNPHLSMQVMQQALQMIIELTGARLSQDIQSNIIKTTPPSHPVAFSYQRCFELMGKEISKSSIRQIFDALGFCIESEGSDGMLLQIPASKPDICREADVIEEIMRLYGYHQIPASNYIRYAVSDTNLYSMHHMESEINLLLQGAGWHEMMNLSLEPNFSTQYSRILVNNPLSQDLLALRTSLLNGSLKTLAHNVNHRNTHLRFFEWGNVYHHAGQATEGKKLGLVCSGDMIGANVHQLKFTAVAGYLKSIFQLLFDSLGISTVTEQAISADGLKVSYALMFQKQNIGFWGSVSEAYKARHELKGDVYYAELDALQLLKLKTSNKYTEIVKFPYVERDLSILINVNTPFREIHDLLIHAFPKIIKSVTLFDRYKNAQMASQHALGIRIKLQDAHKTLSEQEIEQVMNVLVKKLETEFSCSLR